MALNDLWYTHAMELVRANINKIDIYPIIVQEHENNLFIDDTDLTDQHRHELFEEFSTGLYRSFGIHPINTLLLEFGKRMAYSEEEFIRDYIEELRG